MLGGPTAVLLVEDNPSDVYLISAVLEAGDRPKCVSAVGDGQSAIDFLERRGKYESAPVPEIILLDLNLPKMDGHQVLAYIKSTPALRHIPVLVLSSSHREADIRSAYDLRANCYLTKPGDLDEYFDLVKQIDEYWLTQVELC
jgi:two-component system, chemotaxis family, response regulator Rcp1